MPCCRFPAKFERFNAMFVPNYQKTKAKAQGIEVALDDSKTCPLATHYDGDIHDALANMRRLDGSIPRSEKYGQSVNFFTEKGTRKYWVKASTPPFG